MSLQTDVKMFLGVAPYNTATNYIAGDGYFYQGICKKYGKDKVKNEIEKIQRGGK